MKRKYWVRTNKIKHDATIDYPKAIGIHAKQISQTCIATCEAGACYKIAKRTGLSVFDFCADITA